MYQISKRVMMSVGVIALFMGIALVYGTTINNLAGATGATGAATLFSDKDTTILSFLGLFFILGILMLFNKHAK